MNREKERHVLPNGGYVTLELPEHGSYGEMRQICGMCVEQTFGHPIAVVLT